MLLLRASFNSPHLLLLRASIVYFKDIENWLDWGYKIKVSKGQSTSMSLGRAELIFFMNFWQDQSKQHPASRGEITLGRMLNAWNKQKAPIYLSKIQLHIVTGGFSSWWDLTLSKSTETKVGLWCCREIQYSCSCGDFLLSGLNSAMMQLNTFAMAKSQNGAIFIFLLSLPSPLLLYPCCTREDTGIQSNQIKSSQKWKIWVFDRKSKLSTVSGVPMQGGLLSGFIKAFQSLPS